MYDKIHYKKKKKACEKTEVCLARRLLSMRLSECESAAHTQSPVLRLWQLLMATGPKARDTLSDVGGRPPPTLITTTSPSSVFSVRRRRISSMDFACLRVVVAV